MLRAEGSFAAQDCVRLCDAEGRELARGLANYSSAEVAALLGDGTRSATASFSALGYAGVAELVHRENVCFTALLPDAASDAEEEEGA